MPKVYLSPSGQIHNVGVGTYGTEEARCRKVAELTARLLREAGVQVDMTPREWNSKLPDGVWLSKVVARSNAFGADAHIAIHTNAGGRTSDGTDAWYYPGSVRGKALATAIHKRVAPLSPGRDGGLHTSPIFYETRAARAAVAYIELAHHTNPADALSIIGHSDDYAEAIAEGICAALGVAISDDPAETDIVLLPKAKRSELKQLLLTFGLRSQLGSAPLKIAGWEGIKIESDHWGEATRRLAWRVSGRLHQADASVSQSAKPTLALFNLLKKGA